VPILPVMGALLQRRAVVWRMRTGASRPPYPAYALVSPRIASKQAPSPAPLSSSPSSSSSSTSSSSTLSHFCTKTKTRATTTAAASLRNMGRAAEAADAAVDVEALNGFLRGGRAAAASGDTPVTLVMGNEAADLDSMAGPLFVKVSFFSRLWSCSDNGAPCYSERERSMLFTARARVLQAE